MAAKRKPEAERMCSANEASLSVPSAVYLQRKTGGCVAQPVPGGEGAPGVLPAPRRASGPRGRSRTWAPFSGPQKEPLWVDGRVLSEDFQDRERVW